MSKSAFPPGSRHRIRRGITTVELLVGLVALGIVMVGMSILEADKRRTITAYRAAQHLVRLADASQAYVLSNFAALESAATGGPVAIPISTVLSAGGGFSGLNASSPIAGQSVCLSVRRVSAGVLEPMLISTGGSAAPASMLGDLQEAAGYDSGEIRSGLITGKSGWGPLAAANWNASGCAPADGRYVYAMFSNSQKVASGSLNRFAIPGVPDANRMSTILALGQTCDDPTTPAIETNADCGIKADGQATNEPGLDRRRIQLINSLISGVFPASANGGDLAISSSIAAPVIRPTVEAAIGAPCSTGVGAISRDSSGAPLFCNTSGVWSVIGSSSSTNSMVCSHFHAGSQRNYVGKVYGRSGKTCVNETSGNIDSDNGQWFGSRPTAPVLSLIHI